MGHKAEFGEGWDIPGFVEFLVKKKVLEDLSWREDGAPFFGRQDAISGVRVGLLVDHPLESIREIGGARFSVVLSDEGSSMDHDETYEELEEALEDLFKCLGQWAEKFDPGQKALVEDPQGLKNRLLAEYYDRR